MTADTTQRISMLLQIYRCPLPTPRPVSLLLSVAVPLPLRDKCQCVGMYRCWSVIVRSEAWAHGNKSASSIPPPLRTWLFVQGSGPFCHATGDPRPLSPSSTRSQLNPNSCILMSRVRRHPPPDTLLDKDTCDSTLCRPLFSELFVGGRPPAGH